ncbi:MULTISPECIES: class I SAM-dependent methyltransferase [unclassified Thioalkalivibrio]|uniref:class I SAM-dependent methyltransferase n=1 Tax=unclassified Thioalkalivibrio TaxID=2621013 RepID=UPI00037CED4A|nr:MULTISPECIES: class I SAM-dependent methyltransferase [unclassified Thioalkalivibrio]
MSAKPHWEHVYQTRATDAVGWYQAEARTSRALIEAIAPDHDAAIVDVGGGASVLVDELLEDGYCNLTVLDWSAAALARARERVGANAGTVVWQEADVLEHAFPEAGFDVWHDRAVFHFLIDADARARYVRQMRHALCPGGHVVIGTFAPDGPETCSGLPVQRHSPDTLQDAFGPEFVGVQSQREVHVTPGETEQPFNWCVFRKDA